jgi:hypothetical protein
MSVGAIHWALGLTGIDATAHLLLIQLANLADQDGECFPSRNWLAKRMGCSTDTIDRKVALLRRAGLVDVQTQSHTSGAQRVNRYVLAGGRTAAAPSGEGGSRTAAAPGGRTAAEGGAALRAAPINDTKLYTTTADAYARETPAWQKVVEEVNSPLLDPSRTLAIVTGGIEVDHWVRDGADLRLDIIPTIRAICEQRLRAPVKSWAYFRDAVREATARRIAPPNPIQPAMENTSGPSVVAITPARRPQSPTAIAFALAAEARRREALSSRGVDLRDDGVCPPDPDH